MLALAVSGPARDGKVFLLAWSGDRTTWEAIEMNQVGTLTFEDNRARATPRVRQLLADTGGLGPALAERGVVIDDDKGLVALNFRRAQKYYGIRPLP